MPPCRLQPRRAGIVASGSGGARPGGGGRAVPPTGATWSRPCGPWPPHSPCPVVVANDPGHAPWHPGRCARITLADGTLVGHAGELHPKALAALELPARAVAAEFDVDVLVAASDRSVQAAAFSTFPPALTDVALLVASDVPAADVEARAALRRRRRRSSRSCCSTSTRASGSRRAHRSLAYRLTFRAAGPDADDRRGQRFPRRRGGAAARRRGRSSADHCMHEYASTCIVMQRDQGSSGGGERVRRRRDPPAPARPPGVRDRRRHRGAAVPGSGWASVHPHLRPLADRDPRADHAPRCWPATTSSSSRCRTDTPPRSPRSCPTTVVVIDCGADFRLEPTRRRGRRSTAPPHAGTWPYGLPELPAGGGVVSATGSPGATPDRGARAATRPPSRSPWRPASPPGLLEPDDVVVVAASGTSGAGKGAQAAPARQRGDGLDVALRRRRRPPAHPRDRAEPRPRRRGEPVSRLLHPDARADAARHPRHLHRPAARPASTPPSVRAAWETAYADEPFVHLLPEGQWPRDRATSSAATPCTCRSPSTSGVGRVVVVAAIDNLTKGTAGAAVQCVNLALGLHETPGCPIAGVAP